MSSTINMYKSIFAADHVAIHVAGKNIQFEYKNRAGGSGNWSPSLELEHLGEVREIEDPWVVHVSARHVLLGYLDVIPEEAALKFVIKTDYLHGGVEALFLVITRKVKRGRGEAKTVENYYLVDVRISQNYKIVKE